jgi:hypothetical protein
MSHPVRQHNNIARLLPTPPRSANSVPSESTNVPVLNLPYIVQKESAGSTSERPHLRAVTESPEGQTSAPKKPPPPIPRWAMVPTTARIESDQTSSTDSNPYPEVVDSLSSTHRGMPLPETVRPKVGRRLTVSPAGKRLIAKSPPKLASKELNSSPPFSPSHSQNAETRRSLDENHVAKFNREFDEFAAELEDEFVDEFVGILSVETKPEKSTKSKPKSDSSKSSKLATSLDDLGIHADEMVQHQSGFNSPEKKIARPQLQRTRHERQLSAAPRARLPHAAVQNHPDDAGFGSEN